MKVFSDDLSCIEYLEKMRWPNGFECPYCHYQGEPYYFDNRPLVLRCPNCRRDIHLTAGTVMEQSHTPICTWFWAAYLLVTQTPGMSALQFQRQLGLSRYETAFQMFHKLREAMIRPDRDKIGKPYDVEIDETFVGGKTKGEGHGVHHKKIVVGAVEIREGKGGKYGGRLRLRQIKDRSEAELEGFIVDSVLKGTTITTDAWPSYNNLSYIGYKHYEVPMKGDPDEANTALPEIHRVFSNLKTWIRGTHHVVSSQHLQAYLNEYVFRFNRRFYPFEAFNSILKISVGTIPPTYKEIYSGKYQHPLGLL